MQLTCSGSSRWASLAIILALCAANSIAAEADTWIATDDLFLQPPTVSASGTIDQQNIVYGGGGLFGNLRIFGQTFTPGVTGWLTQIDLYADTWSGGATLPARVSVVEVANHSPGGVTLFWREVPWQSRGWLSVSLPATSVFLVSGHQYGLVVTCNDDQFNLEPDDSLGTSWHGNQYAGGELWELTPGRSWALCDPFDLSGSSDLLFRTWMTLPEPAMPGLVAGFALMLTRRRNSIAHP